MPRYEITTEQTQQFLNAGYVLLPSAMPPALLARWRDLATHLEVEAIEAYHRAEPLKGSSVEESPMGTHLKSYDDILEVAPDAVLDLLACPAVMAVARQLCGRGVVPLQVYMVYKPMGSVIKWHQDAPHPRDYPYLTVGIYLDAAQSGDGCLRYVPGTQHELQDIAKLSAEHGWAIPGMVEQPANAGDFLVHDIMTLHGSPCKRLPGSRRTIYVEFRPAAGIVESGAQSERWIELRKRWMGLVLRRCYSVDWPAAWSSDIPTNLGRDEDEIAEIFAYPEPAIPSVYSAYPVRTDDYPFPSDLSACVSGANLS